jgi:hypothetical protein
MTKVIIEDKSNTSKKVIIEVKSNTSKLSKVSNSVKNIGEEVDEAEVEDEDGINLHGEAGAGDFPFHQDRDHTGTALTEEKLSQKTTRKLIVCLNSLLGLQHYLKLKS